MPTPITIPLINPTEPEALLAAVHLSPGQAVAPGDLIATLETTKSSADLLAEAGGFFVGLRFQSGEVIPAGEVLAYLAESPDWAPPAAETDPAEETHKSILPEGLRITQPALALARAANLDLAQFPQGALVTESAVRARLIGLKKGAPSLPKSHFDPTALVIYGGGGHGKSVLDLLRVLGTYRVLGFIDDGLPAGEDIMGLPVLGDGGLLPELYAQGVRLAVNAVGGIGEPRVRRVVFERLLAAGFGFPAVAHPTATLEPSATLSPGVQVFHLAYVGSEVGLGFGTIVNTGAIISHECLLGDLVNISPGAILAGGVQVGDGALVGMGVTVNLGVTIGAGARVGNGATVKADVPAGGLVPAGTVWPRG
ncbi:MAG: NeuD/PglB/VioB family sugar acetyltransferase [Anaerolineales bacterium]|nr:NeuD/PglB/VioB family sugar acetyltransferase [Anaerolineales bacterium]